MKNLYTLILTFILLPTLLFAAEGIQYHVLDNGMQVYLKEDHARPLVSLFSIVDGGSRTETDDIAGLSHFYEHLIARGGSAKQEETEYRRAMMLLGQSHIYTYDDGTAYGFTVPMENFDEALWRLADFMLELRPDTVDIAKERTIVMEEYYMSYGDNPSGWVYELVHREAFKEHPYYPTTIGLPEVIESASLEKLVTFYEERYVPNQIVMAVVGDFRSEEMIGKLEEQFGYYRAGPISFELGRTEPEQTEFRQIGEEMETSASYLLLGYHIPPTASPDMPALRVLAQVLGGTDDARLQKALQTDKNLVSSLWVWPDFLRDASLLYVGTTCSLENEQSVLETCFAEIKKLAQQGITEEELAAAKKKLITEDKLKKETYRGQAENICQFAISNAPSLAENYEALIRAVTADDVKYAVQRYLDAQQATLALVVPQGNEIRDYASLAADYSFADMKKPEQAGPGEHVSKQVLPNGVTLISAPDPNAATVCVSVFARGGQWLEGEGKAGLGYLVASLLNRGTEEYDREELANLQAGLSLDFWSTAYEDYLHVGFNGLAEDSRDGLHLLIQMLFHPAFSEDEFEQAKLDQVRDIQGVVDQPWEYTHREALRDLYHKSPYRTLVNGIEEDIRHITLKDVQNYYDRAFAPANIVVAIAGQFDPERVVKRFGEVGGGKAKRDEKLEKIDLVQDQPETQIRRRLEYKQKDQNTFNISFLTVGVDHPDYLPLVVTTRILNTRLFFKYVYEKGMAYRMWSRMHPRLGQARFYFEMGCSDENFEIAVPGILQDLDDFLHQEVTNDMLTIAIQDEITRNRMKYQNNREIADGLGYWEMMGLGYQFFDRFQDQLSWVTADDVERVAREYLGVDRYQLVNVGTAPVK